MNNNRYFGFFCVATLASALGVSACSDDSAQPAVVGAPGVGGAPGTGGAVEPAVGGTGGASTPTTGGTGGVDQPSSGDPPTVKPCTQDSECANGHCDNGTCGCWDPNQMFCGDQCLVVGWDYNNCGTCNRVCPATLPDCDSGQCVCYTGTCGGTDVTNLPNPQGMGFATRYWDCCKSHCGWTANTGGITPLSSCNQQNQSLGTDYAAQSACDGGPAFQCYNLGPWAVSDTLAYGFAAIPNSADACGKCFELTFTGGTNIGVPPGDPGSIALAGKRLIVQGVNVGYDVQQGQFDILIPGGGVGAFNACSTQWGMADLGSQYGGFLETCKQQLGREATLDAYKTCVAGHCARVFGSGLPDLLAACTWFVDWFQVADNPRLDYQEVACPAELVTRTGMSR